MTKELSDRAKRRILGRSPEWIRKFDVNDYLQNQPMIEKLHEEKQLALALSLDLERHNEELVAQIRELELDNQRLSMLVNEHRRQSSILFAISLLSAVLAGIGANVATDAPTDWKGWVMVASSVVLEVTAFLIAYRKRD